MKSDLIKLLKEEYGLRKILGKKLELYNFYTLCGFYKRLKNGEVIK